MPNEDEQNQFRAEFYQCLSRAFLPPMEEELWVGMRDYLADDLSELGQALGLETGSGLADYTAAMRPVTDRLALLQRYSALFLAPSIRLGINTAAYLDGALGGGSVLAMEKSYRRAGFEADAGFGDLPDHVSIQLEFVARCFRLSQNGNVSAGRQAREFLGSYVARWLPPFISDLEKRDAPSNPWLPLARILKSAVDRDAFTVEPQPPQQRRLVALAKARHKRAQAAISEKELALIARRLRENGLSTDHLAIPPEQRDEARGWERKSLPTPQRSTRFGTFPQNRGQKVDP